MLNFPDFLDEPADSVAPKLLGCLLEREYRGAVLRGRIVETEAYDQTDEASHTFRGKTKRNEIMFGEAGHLYVYFTYGMHYCCNIVTGPTGYGSGVLIRAIEPIDGLDAMEKLRGKSGVQLTNGPGKVCQALAIDLNLGGHNLRNAPLQLTVGKLELDEKIAISNRIGISRAKDLPRRYFIAGNRFVSRYK